MSTISVSGYCLLLKNQECKVRKVIIDNDYLTFPYKIGINRCIGSCNDKDNPYFKVCLPCKCGCLLDEKVYNNLQK